jgi:recombination protein RecA
METLLKKYRDIISVASTPHEHQRVSMGPLSLNLLLGHPDGIEAGRIVQVTGKPSHGKTTLVLDMCAQYLNTHPDQSALFLDFERTFDGPYAAACGVPVDRLLVLKANYAEEGLRILEEAIEQGIIQFAVVDSVPAALPKDELDKDFGDRQKMAGSAGIITRFCQRSVGLLDNKSATVVLVNQMRKNFSLMSHEDEIPFGGLALQYASSVIINVYRKKAEDGLIQIEATIKKSKVSAPLGRAIFTLRYGSGIDHALDVVDVAVDHDLVEKNGAWYTYKDKKVQGTERASREFPISEIRERIIKEVANAGQ